MIHYAISDSLIGQVLLAQTDKGICSVILGDTHDALIRELTQQFKDDQCEASSNAESALKQLCQLIKHPDTQFDFPLDLQGTAFQKGVWQALQTIPLGQTFSYKQLAQKMGKPQAVRAVANACAANKLAIIIPCHRVIGSQGQLTGYRWGLERKQQLLSFEQSLR